MPNGKIQPEFVERLHAMGEWLRKNGESIYGTRGGPVTPRPWGVTTQKAGKIYVHVFDWSDELLALPKLANVRSAALLGSGTDGGSAAGGWRDFAAATGRARSGRYCRCFGRG